MCYCITGGIERVNMAKRTSKGFTLIELLIVVAIIGILASVAIPMFASYRQKAYDAGAQVDLRNIRTSLEAFYTEYFHYPY